MKLEINKAYPMPCTAQVAWEFLQNLEAVAACMPGAKITERIDAAHYRGTVTARVGPASMSFRGEVEMQDLDPAARSLRLLGKGTDSTGTSAAALSLRAHIETAPQGRCTLVGASEMSMSGKVTAFAGRMMNTVAEQILQQFAANFAAQVGALEAQRSGARESAQSAPASAASGSELNVLALAWTLLRNWLRRMLSRTAA